MQEYTRSEIERRRAVRIKRIRRRKRKKFCGILCVTALLIAAAITVSSVIKAPRESPGEMSDGGSEDSSKNSLATLATAKVPEYVNIQMIPKGGARKGNKLNSLKYIVVHYVGNPGTTAQNNRDYFANKTTEVCSHFVIGLDGEIIQCLPLNERSAASNERNRDSISIEVCHPDKSGKFNPASYNALVKLTVWLCETADLDAESVIRHYDVTGKLCPLYYVENPDEWNAFKNEIKLNLQGGNINA